MDIFHDLIVEAVDLVRYYINNGDKRPEYMLEKQLIMIIEELNKMDKIRDSEVFFPYYPKGMSDSWDMSDPIAWKLLNVLDIYRKL